MEDETEQEQKPKPTYSYRFVMPDGTIVMVWPFASRRTAIASYRGKYLYYYGKECPKETFG